MCERQPPSRSYCGLRIHYTDQVEEVDKIDRSVDRNRAKNTTVAELGNLTNYVKTAMTWLIRRFEEFLLMPGWIHSESGKNTAFYNNCFNLHEWFKRIRRDTYGDLIVHIIICLTSVTRAKLKEEMEFPA